MLMRAHVYDAIASMYEVTYYLDNGRRGAISGANLASR
jgi:hypothetical protein